MSPFHAQRQEVIDTCLQLAEQGYLAGTGGNVALRLDAAHIAVTPTAADYYTLEVEDICVLRLDTLAQAEGRLAPSVESGLHAALLRAKPAMQASVHTHQPLASAMALLNTAIPLPLPADQALLGREVAIVPYAPSGTGLLVRALRRRLLPEIQAYLLRNHGLICAARSLPEAVDQLGRIERAAASFLRQRIAARASGGLQALTLAALTDQP
ncbi:class II aldolase/adducin family protein [Chitinimonas sp.]|uniref:class II aldolase/adducin family protein n=1 Tax=Chitinimonas sp. TaxID=1934313 RepID=UPI002F93C9F9